MGKILAAFALLLYGPAWSVGDYPQFSYPGESIKEGTFRVTIMGSSFEPSRAQANCSVLIETASGEKFVFDLGAGSLVNYNRMAVPPNQLDKIFLSHLHVDHYSDLTYLYGMGPGMGRHTPLKVWGPASTKDEWGVSHAMRALKDMTAWHRESFAATIPVGDAFVIEVNEIPVSRTSITVYDRDGITITAFPALHIMTGAVSYRFEMDGLSIVYSGDSAPSKFMIENARNVDLLIHEVRSPALQESMAMGGASHERNANAANSLFNTMVHTPAEMLGQILDQTRPNMAVLNHVAIDPRSRIRLVDSVRQHFAGDIRIAEDLMVFDVTPNGVLQRMAIGIDSPSWGNFPVADDVPPATGIGERLEPWIRDGGFRGEQ